ncbi:uncharacterized protein LOC144086699 isoform X4 [Stigmatopora argus]
MAHQSTTSAIDNILFQLASEARELTQRKNDINQEIEVNKTKIARRRTCIETTRADIKTLKENADMKQNNLNHNRALAKSMKVTQGMLLQYERTLKLELENIKANYNNEKDVYEEKMASYRKLFHDHQMPYVLNIQVQNDDMESSFTASQDEVTTVNVKEAGRRACVTDFSVPRSTSDEDPEWYIYIFFTIYSHTNCYNVCSNKFYPTSELHPHPPIETVTQMEHSPIEGSTAAIQAANVDDAKLCASCPETFAAKELPSRAWDLSSWMPDGASGNEDVAGPDDLASREEKLAETPFRKTRLSVVLEEDEEAQWKMEEGDATVEEEQPPQEHSAALSPAESQQTPISASFPVPKMPTFSFNFSPARSLEGSSENKSPGFTFSTNSNPSTPGFLGFSCDDGGDEDAPFMFSSSFFKNKTKQENKSDGLDFLFNKSDQSDDFQLPFTSSEKEDSDIDFAFPFKN